MDIGGMGQDTVTVRSGCAFSPLFDLVPRDLGRRTAGNADEVVMVPGRTRTIELLAASSYGVGDPRIHQ